MNIGLLGGKFNPPHIGHILIAQQMLDFGGFDEVWFVPNFGQSFHEPVASVADRLAMTRCMKLSRTRISTIEIDNHLDGKTINLVPYLPKGNTYTFIIGSDQLATFHLWGSYKELIQKLPFVIFPRYGYPNEPLYDHMTVVTHPALIATNISSTKIRERVKLGLSIDDFVPEGVAVYIKKHTLYL